MTVLIEMTSRDQDLFYWPKPNTHGMPTEYWKLASEIDTLQARYIRLCDVEPIPVIELEEIDDQIKQLEKIKSKVYEQVMKGAYCEQI